MYFRLKNRRNWGSAFDGFILCLAFHSFLLNVFRETIRMHFSRLWISTTRGALLIRLKFRLQSHFRAQLSGAIRLGEKRTMWNCAAKMGNRREYCYEREGEKIQRSNELSKEEGESLFNPTWTNAGCCRCCQMTQDRLSPFHLDFSLSLSHSLPSLFSPQTINVFQFPFAISFR